MFCNQFLTHQQRMRLGSYITEDLEGSPQPSLLLLVPFQPIWWQLLGPFMGGDLFYNPLRLKLCGAGLCQPESPQCPRGPAEPQHMDTRAAGCV